MEFSTLVWGDASTWPYIGYIKTFFPNPEIPGGYSVATGSLIAPRVVLTAGHVVFDPEQGGAALSVEIKFAGPQVLTCVSNQIDYTTQWRDQDSLSSISSVSAFDCGVIILPQGIDRFVTPMPFNTASDSMLAGMTLSVAGYPAFPESTRGTIIGAQFNLIQGSALPEAAAPLESYRMFYPVQTVPGMSGGPVYSFDPASNVRTVRGIHTSFPPWIGLGSALRITDSIYQLIQDWVSANRP